MKLYEIAQELQQILDYAHLIAEDNEGVLPDSLSDEIDSLQLSRDEKVLSVSKVYKGKLAEAEAISAEIKKLSGRVKSLESSAEWLKGYIRNHIQEGEKLSDATTALSWRKSESVDILDGAILETKYLRVTVAPDKTAIKDDLKKGIAVKDCKLVTKQNLQIK